MQIDGPRADSATTWKTDPRLTVTRKQRPKAEYAGAHLTNQIVRRLSFGRRLDHDLHRMTIAFDVAIECGKQQLRGVDVFQSRHIIKTMHAIGQQG